MHAPTECWAGAALAWASADACRDAICLPAARAGAASDVAAISATVKSFSLAICFSPYVSEADKRLASEARDELLFLRHITMQVKAANAPDDRTYARSSQGTSPSEVTSESFNIVALGCYLAR